MSFFKMQVLCGNANFTDIGPTSTSLPISRWVPPLQGLSNLIVMVLNFHSHSVATDDTKYFKSIFAFVFFCLEERFKPLL